MKSSSWLLVTVLVALLALVPFLISEGDERVVAGPDIARPEAPASVPAEPTLPQRALPSEPAVERQATGGAQHLGVLGPVRLGGPGSLDGRVVDFDRRGLAEMRVDLSTMPPVVGHWADRVLRLIRRNEWLPNTRAVASVMTADDGSFSFEGVRRGTYFLDTRGERWVGEVPVQVRVNAQGSGGPVDIFAIPAGTIAGRVVRADGSGVSGAKVAGFHGISVLLSALRRGEARFVETRTARDGSFELVGLPPGPGYDVAASGSGFALSHAIDLTVRAHEKTQIVLEARDGAVLTGVVLAPSVSAEGVMGDLEPVAGAHVGAIPLGLRDLHFAPEILATTQAKTDANGRFVLRHVPPGEVDAVAWAPERVPGVSSSVPVLDGSRIDGVEVVLKGGAMATGRVVDGEGTPLAGVRVRWDLHEGVVDDQLLRFAPFLTQALDAFAFPLTDAAGQFRAGPFLDDPPHDLDFEKGGYETVERQWSPGDGPMEVVLLQGGAIAGIVMDAAQATPVPEFSVLAPTLATPGQPVPFNPIAAPELVEDPEGRFQIDGVEPGMHTLLVSAPGYRTEAVAEIEVKRGEVTRGIIVSLVPGSIVSGIVLDPDGAPVARAHVVALTGDEERVQGSAPQTAGANVSVGIGLGSGTMGDLGLAAGLGLLPATTVRSGDDGRFTIEGVEPGPVRVCAVHPDFAGGTSDSLLLGEGERLNDVEVLLSNGGGIYGQVTDLMGEPVPKIIVAAFSPSNAGEAGGFVYQAVSDDEGFYSIKPMSPGSYFIVLTRGDEALNPLSFMGRFNFDLVHVPDGQQVEHDVVDKSAGACRVHGFVRLAGEPVVGGVLVAISHDADNLLGMDFKMARVDAHGAYEFAGLQPGDYEFKYEADSNEYSIPVEVPELPEYAFDIRLPEGRIEGRVVDSERGAGIQNGEVRLKRLNVEPRGGSGLIADLFASESTVDSEYTDLDGSFSFTGLSAGEYELSAGGPRWGAGAGDYAPGAPSELELGPDEIRSGLEIRLEPTLFLRGVVLDPGGQPIEGALVSAFVADGDAGRPNYERTDADGRFEVKGLAAGPYHLSASHEDFADSLVEEIVLPSAAADNARLALTRGAEVEVVVFDAGGQPAAGAFAQLISVDGSQNALDKLRRNVEGIFDGSGVTGADGRLALGRYAPGSYRLEVRRASTNQVVEGIELEEGGFEELTVTLDR